jgi:hypothetical protein
VNRSVDVWERFASSFETDANPDWVVRGLRPVVRAAHRDPVLRGLFPYQSMSRLCFEPARQSDRYANPYPCIEFVNSLQTYWVIDRPYENESGPRAVRLGETAVPEDAIAIVREHLPDR